jgi:hypothetical protein
MEPQPTTLDLVVQTNPDGTPFFETIFVEQLAANRYRVRVSPGLLQGLAAGDELALTPEEAPGFRVLQRAGNVSVQFFWKGDLAGCAQELTPRVVALGGWLDAQATGLLVFTFPLAVGFPAIERLLGAAEQQYPGCAWMYGNVYDPIDGETPLNWWLPAEP